MADKLNPSDGGIFAGVQLHSGVDQQIEQYRANLANQITTLVHDCSIDETLDVLNRIPIEQRIRLIEALEMCTYPGGR